MSFLTIPSQEGLFATIKRDKSAEETEGRSPDDEEEEEEEEDEDDDTANVHLIPRCSPVLRKRGPSIYDETAEYIRIHQALSLAKKRVSFADTTGGDLVDVKEFIAFESDDDEDAARWEEEEAKYRRRERQPTYQVHPEFHALVGDALLQTVRTNKVEVEKLCPVEDEPLAVSGLIRVLNISFHKSVYIRSTMDSWGSYFDHPADYVQGSHDGETDQFSFKLSFAPPYVTHGARIEFVVRYETADGDFWANNFSTNYVVTLLLSYDDSAQAEIDMEQIRGILKPPKVYSLDDDLDSEESWEKEEEEAGTSKSGLVRPTAICPVIVQPQIDIEIAIHPSGSSAPPNQEFPSVDGTPSARTVSPGEQFPCTSIETTLQSNSSFVLCANESVQPHKSQPLPRLHCELDSQTSEQPTDSSPSAPLPSVQQESRPRSYSSQTGGDEILPSEGSCMRLPTAETNLCPNVEDESPKSPAIHPCQEPATAHVSAPTVIQVFEQEAALGPGELVAGLSEGSTRSAAHHEGSTPPTGSEGDDPPLSDLAENISASAGVTKATQNLAPRPVSAWEEENEAPQISPDTLLENLSNTLSAASEPQSELDVNRNLIPSVIFLSGVVSLSIVMQEPSALFFIGLLLVLRRL